MKRFLHNLWHWRTAWAVRYLSKQLQKDKAFRDSWQANMAVSIQDEMRVEVDSDRIGQANYLLSNRMADRLMKHLFNA